jgi:2'-5' RNA ligase
VAGGDRIRLFCALRLPERTLDELERWQAAHLSGGRTVERGNLHVTLAFLGGRPGEELPQIAGELAAAARAAGELRLAGGRYRETRSVGMVVLEDVNGAATAFADEVGERLERNGAYRRETRPWLPHVTVLRFRERPRLRPPGPELGEVSPSDAAVYRSVLRSTGAQYEVMEAFTLGFPERLGGR